MSFRNVFSGVALQHAACRVARGCRTRPGQLYSSSERGRSCPIHPELMKILVCPLSKEPLRAVKPLEKRSFTSLVPVCERKIASNGKLGGAWYNASTNELVCDKLGVAYPIIDGVPNLVPQDGRLISTSSREENT